jgi:lipopolysaccharide biosynthesis glycosyltransferase
VIGDISEIADLNFCHSNNSILKNDELYIYASSHNYSKDDIQRLRKIGYTSDDYFNAGVMYINLMRWREEKISERLMHIANKYKDDLLFWDQDVLNIAFEDSWEKLDFSFNAFNLEQKASSDQYKIIHYTGSSKPWHFVNKHPYKKEYFDCLKLTPFSNYKPKDITLKNAIIRFLIPAKVFKFIKSRK